MPANWEFDRAAFEALQAGLVCQFESHFPDPLAPKTVVVVPSQTLDQEILAKVSGISHYEERLLCLLMLLRMPRTRMIYVTSLPIDEAVVDYYLHLLPGVPPRHARQRLTLLSCHDGSPRSLTEKILERPRLIEKIRQHIPEDHVAHMVGFNITPYEHRLALKLGIPIYGTPHWFSHFGTKTGSRELFRQAGLLLPPGYEGLRDMTDALQALRMLKYEHPHLRKAVVKLNDGFSGDGNATYSYEKHGMPHSDDDLRAHLKLVAKDMEYDTFSQKMAQMGGIVEAFIDGEEKTSPSVQCRITPLRQIEVVSTHDQLLGGHDGQVYLGATFPANSAYANEIGQLGHRVAQRLAAEGVIGRFGIDFVSVKEPGHWWQHYAIEINLRKGGTTHPYLMLQFLTDGYYDHHTGEYQTPHGQARYYFATDNMQSDAYRGLTPDDLLDIAVCHDIHYDAAVQEGVVFHLLGALSQYGKLGSVCIGATPERAKGFYEKTKAVLDEVTSL
ncbi:MAG: peptide ligase PGM1-related protein [Saprospiraceae bacterium]|nr:peptide ligase PGM1-related protein [Saprospiraceae bacterium]MDW8230128.1 peptide ligase PGM1-related protein [Saprospiraceae bacterium]